MAEHANADARSNPKAPTKATLVDAGLHLMLEKGYHHTGIQEVLQAAGVPKGSFYYYFPSKEAFGREVIAQFAAAYVERLERWLGETTQSPLTRLHRHLDETLTHFERRGCRGGCLIGNLSQELADQSVPFGAQLEAVFADWRERYARLFREAQAVGELRADLDPQQLAGTEPLDPERSAHASPPPLSPAPLCLGHSRGDRPHRRAHGRRHRGACRADPPARSRLRLGSRGDCARRLHQCLPLWPRRAFRRAADAARRPAARDAVQSALYCRRCGRLDADPDRVPSLSPLGGGGRCGDREYRPGAERHRGESLVYDSAGPGP